jgi:hypothetical protein
MVRPFAFGYNPQTAVNNLFQLKTTNEAIAKKALLEFDALVTILQTKGVEVHVVQDTQDPLTPDALFPNNWISFHETGEFFLYPMFALNRRAERKASVLQYVEQRFSFFKKVDLSFYEQQDFFLEGTGSLVLDRNAKIAYVCRSPRTHERVLNDFCQIAGYTPCIFDAADSAGFPYYHTNVMMTVTNNQVIVCLDSIADDRQRQQLLSFCGESKKQVVTITRKQVSAFAGNMLELQGHGGLPLLVMSTKAYRSLTPLQCEQLSVYNEIVHCALSTIEEAGGGSARCMLAEIPG